MSCSSAVFESTNLHNTKIKPVTNFTALHSSLGRKILIQFKKKKKKDTINELFESDKEMPPYFGDFIGLSVFNHVTVEELPVWVNVICYVLNWQI